MWPFKAKAAPPTEAKYAPPLVLGMGPASWTGHGYRALATEGFQNNPIVHACVTKLARASASVDLHLYDYTRQGKLRRIDRHAILDLVNAPNPVWSGRQFREKLATHYLIGGNAYVLGDRPAGPQGELWLLPPEYVTVQSARGRLLPQGYKYQPGGEEKIFPVDQVTGLSQVLHLRTVHPLDEWHGLPPLTAAAYGVDIFNAGQEWNKSLLQNEGRPSGALQMRQGKDGLAAFLTDEQFTRIKGAVDEQYSGAANAGRPLLLEGGLEWVQMGLNSRDMDHKETMLTNARFIAACYGTPPMLVNIPGESTFSNYGEAKLAYWSDTVLPLLGLLLEDINRWLAAQFGEKVFLWYDEEQIPALEPLRDIKSKRINNSEYLTVNEKREAMGHERHDDPNADDILVSTKDIPLGKLGELDPLLHPQLATDVPADPAKPADKPASKSSTEGKGESEAG